MKIYAIARISDIPAPGSTSGTQIEWLCADGDSPDDWSLSSDKSQRTTFDFLTDAMDAIANFGDDCLTVVPIEVSANETLSPMAIASSAWLVDELTAA